MMKDDDRWLETTEVDIQLSCAIQKLESVVALEEQVFLRPTVRRKMAEIEKHAFNLRNLTRHSRELFSGFEEYIYVGGEGNNPLDKFEKEVLDLAYQVEDATSSFLCRRDLIKKRQQGLMKYMTLFNNLSDLHDDMFKEIMDAKNAFTSTTNFSSFAIDDASSLFSDAYMLSRKATDYSLKFGRSNFVCCEEKRDGMPSKEYHLWGYLSILGEVGSGKTTFARDIYRAVTNDPKQGFEISAWVSVRPEYKITDIYTDIVQQQEDTNFAVPNEIVRSLGSKGLTERVKKWLESCRFIIVLDDVHYIWSKIKSHFKYLFPIKTIESSTVIITTCEAQTSEITRVIKVLGPLSEKDRWELFKNTLKKANMINQIDKQAEDDALNRIETELPKGIICKMGSYLHLGIITLARLYMTKKHDDQESSPSLSSLIDWDLNFQMLPPTIRQCYLYMGIFPEKIEIPIRRLFRLWIAEGLVVPDLQSSETPEDLALSYLRELETKKVISINKKNGHPKSCCMPSATHKFCSRKAMHLGTFYVHNGSDNPRSRSRARRLVEHAADIEQYPTSDDDYKLRSYISFNNRKRDTPAEQVGVFLGKLVAKNGFGLLRVLDLENVYKPLLPAETLEKLFLLTYLGLRWTFLDSVPDSVGTLQYLETLDVKHTNITILPGTIWKAKNLKHLYMNQVHFDMSINKGFTSSLANLQTLWGLSIGSNKDVVKSLRKMGSLRKLGLTYHSTTAEGIADSISELTNLESLRLRSMDESGHPSELKLHANMTKLEKLSELYLVGVLSYTNNETPVQFPPNLKTLTLTGSQLKNDSLRMLGKLSHLETLRFYGQSYSDDQIIFDKDEFSNLVVLKLWKLVELKTLEMKEGAMSKLEELDIRSCRNLKSTKGLKQVGGLQTITLADMHDDFVATVKSAVNKVRLVVTVLKQVGGLKKITLTNTPGDFVETVKSEANKVRVAVEVLEQVGGLKTTTLINMPDDFVERVKREASQDRVAVEVLDQVGGLQKISLKNTPDDFAETIKSEANRVRVAVEVLEQVDGSQTITLINMPDEFVETVKRKVKSKANKDCVVVKVQNLKSSPTSTNQSNNKMRGRGQGRNSGGRIVCQLCEEPGHTVHDCSHRFDKNFSGNKNQDKSSAHYSSPDVVANPEWLLDSDATNQVTADQSSFQQKSKYGGMDKLIIGNEQDVNVTEAHINTRH